MPSIFELRTRAGWTQKELAERVGVHPNTVARWERGEVTPDKRSRHLMGYIFGVGSDEIELPKREDAG